VVACLALLGVIGVTLMIVDDSPGGQQGRVAGIWCLCITGVFAVLFTVYIAHYEWHLSRREQRARYISKLPDCALCKLPLDGLCSQNHDWMRKKHMSDMSPRSLRRCKDKRGKLSPAFRELLCPVSEGKCGAPAVLRFGVLCLAVDMYCDALSNPTQSNPIQSATM